MTTFPLHSLSKFLQTVLCPPAFTLSFCSLKLGWRERKEKRWEERQKREGDAKRGRWLDRAGEIGLTLLSAGWDFRGPVEPFSVLTSVSLIHLSNISVPER